MRLVQLETPEGQRRVALVQGRSLRLLDQVGGVRELALEAIADRVPLAQLVEKRASCELEDYDRVIAERRLFAPLDHPDPAQLLVSGTGLTHLGSARTRADMHGVESKPAAQTDSMKLFQLGLERGKPADGALGVQPEWFYKGDGSCLTRPGHAFRVPDFSLDAGEEPEVVGLYVVSPAGEPYRVGFALGNELSDHVTERQNYLYLAHSKLRPCAVGPELRLGALPERLQGQSRILRSGQVLWQGEFESGEENMSHRISGLEHHHFKYPMFRRPGSVHLHFFGTATLSFAAGVRCEPGDVFEIECPDFGEPLRNGLERVEARAPSVRQL
ncbi:MAG: AraD1 family protein [Deltaproteobacteria bacterium]